MSCGLNSESNLLNTPGDHQEPRGAKLRTDIREAKDRLCTQIMAGLTDPASGQHLALWPPRRKCEKQSSTKELSLSASPSLLEPPPASHSLPQPPPASPSLPQPPGWVPTAALPRTCICCGPHKGLGAHTRSSALGIPPSVQKHKHSRNLNSKPGSEDSCHQPHPACA